MNAQVKPIRIKERPLPVRVFNHYKGYRKLGLSVEDSLNFAWRVATGGRP